LEFGTTLGKLSIKILSFGVLKRDDSFSGSIMAAMSQECSVSSAPYYATLVYMTNDLGENYHSMPTKRN
jgi:hypothetical protein